MKLNISIEINENATSTEIYNALLGAARTAARSVFFGTLPAVDEERDVRHDESPAVEAIFYRSE